MEPAAPRRPRRDALTDELRRRILSGELPRGQRLGESALARQMGVSRIPLREAFRSLESEGLLEWAFRQGVTVTGVDPAEAGTVAEVRVTLELLAVRLAAEQHAVAPEDEARLAEALAAGESAATEADPDPGSLAELDRSFHRAIAAASGSPLLERLVHLVRQRADHLAVFPDRQSPPDAWADHAAIARAILAHDGTAAEARMRHHLGA